MKLQIDPVPQPEMIFTWTDYRDLIQRVWEIDNQIAHLLRYHLRAPDYKERKAPLNALSDTLQEQYFAHLPIYLLARCPICGSKVTEAVDTYSLNGYGWQNYGPTGYGWLGWSSSKPTYQAGCRHVQAVYYCVNLNSLKPTDVRGPTKVRNIHTVHIGPETPYVISPLLEEKTSCMVLHALPVGRFDDERWQPRYTVYFMTYFTSNPAHFDHVIRQWVAEGLDWGLLVYDYNDYDLVKWVEAKKLFWLNQDDPELPLCSGPAETFPYADIEGRRGICRIEDGRLRGAYGDKTFLDFLKRVLGLKRGSKG